MKLKQNKIVSLAIALSLMVCMYTLPTPAQATAPETPMITGSLANSGDTATYDLQIDHALYPETVLYTFAYGRIGNATVTVYDEAGSRVSYTWFRARLDDSKTEYILAPRSFCYIRNSEGITKNYRIVVEADTDDVGYAINIGTMDEFVEYYGGPNNAATISKNVPPKANYTHSVYYNGAQMVLNKGEWFRYTADGYTYITLSATNLDNLAFEVRDASTLELVDKSTAEDQGIKTIYDSTQYTGYAQKGIELEDGKEYLIKVYSTVHIPTTDRNDRYYLSIGLPDISTHRMNYRPSQAYYVPANTTKTFYINVSDDTIPNSARASESTAVYFSTGRTTESVYITSCKITAPNGQTFTLNSGYFSKFDKASPVNYLESPYNVPIKGTWKVTVKTSKSMNMYFKIIGYCDYIMGHYGN